MASWIRSLWNDSAITWKWKKKKQYLREWRDWDRFKCYPNNEDFKTVKKRRKTPREDIIEEKHQANV